MTILFRSGNHFLWNRHPFLCRPFLSDVFPQGFIKSNSPTQSPKEPERRFAACPETEGFIAAVEGPHSVDAIGAFRPQTIPEDKKVTAKLTAYPYQ